jgi:hypothetical protein
MCVQDTKTNNSSAFSEIDGVLVRLKKCLSLGISVLAFTANRLKRLASKH